MRSIGRGGFALVYEAKQLSTGQRVAVKMLHEDLIDDVHLARFERDLKPANIFLARGPGAKTLPIVLDFGIAKPQEDTGLTMPSAFVGTPQYMAPEQALGSKNVDGRSDQYALGMLAFETMSGKSPFLGMNVFAILNSVASGTIPRPADVIEDLPTGLDRSMARAPEKRFDSMKALGAALLPFATTRGRAQWEEAFAAAPSSEGGAPFDRSEPRPGAAGSEIRARSGQDAQPADIAVNGQDE